MDKVFIIEETAQRQHDEKMEMLRTTRTKETDMIKMSIRSYLESCENMLYLVQEIKKLRKEIEALKKQG